MKEMELVSVIANKKLKYPKANTNPYLKNRLNQNFTIPKPDLVWASDITYVKVNYVNHFICIIMDLFSRKIICFLVSAKNDSELTMEIFIKAYEKRNNPLPLTLHSDRGTQYTA